MCVCVCVRTRVCVRVCKVFTNTEYVASPHTTSLLKDINIVTKQHQLANTKKQHFLSCVFFKGLLNH